MGRPKNPDNEKIKKIRKILRENPQGLWVREIARRSGLDRSTVSRYLLEYMKDEIEDTFPKLPGKLIRVVKLKKR